MILLDTTILVYAVGVDHPLREPSRAVLKLARDGVVHARTTVEVIQEFAHVRSRRRPRADAVRWALNYADALSPLIQPDLEDLLAGLDLFGNAEGLTPFDAVLAGCARRRGCALASADRAFSAVPGLTALDPASATFLDELATLP